MSAPPPDMIFDGPPGCLWGFAYFARCKDSGSIKVGATDNWHWRIKNLRYGKHGRDVEPLLFVRGGFGTERRLHAYFEPYHIGREWFRPSNTVLGSIELIRIGQFDWNELPEDGWAVTKPFQTKASIAHWGPLPQYDSVRAA